MNDTLFSDIYIMIPVDTTNKKDDTNQNSIPPKVKHYLKCIKETSEYECEKKVSDAIERKHLGSYNFLLMDDEYNKVINIITVEIILTTHINTNLGVVNVLFDNTTNITQIEDQMSSKHLFIEVEGNQIEIRKFLAEQFGLNQCGKEKVLVCINQKPKNELELYYMLAGESYKSVHIDYKINADEFRDTVKNIAVYDFYDAYASDNSVIFISERIGSDYFANLKTEVSMIFICEIVMLQNSAISRTNTRIVDELTSNIDVSLKTIENMYVEFGLTIILWDKNIYNYSLSQKLADKIYVAFGNEQLMNEYYRNQNYLEHIIELRATVNSAREGKLLNVLAFILGISQIIQIVGSVIGYVKTLNLNALLVGGIGVSSTTLVIVFILLIKKYMINKKAVQRRLTN